ncbi:DNA-binding MarR family transcriptional regulator [Enterococcus sp. PF1-24]|uniref:MarR family winged helix-turn-helix transcriptional regulator n=1 Tax=unclassified Enterococcus TaxID=2608891 RepID=UPI0024746BBB|nr:MULTISPECIES: MarR family transcriptional regulator [unclassified Enterococcus]MDH6365702.1 DNA-binding MarR family transcriptional regulator [Enterococcus sp. PFB1-1]MDH6402798.1 DNA-binding MarR family transcriptional regulator [Enterococcus sp. PF1-24]
MASKNKNTDILIEEIRQLFLNAANKRTLQINSEKQNLLDNCENEELKVVIQNLTVIVFHILDAIGQQEPINSINISKLTAIPKGTVSKNISKLLAMDLITKSQLPNNKKESIFHLTALGRALFELHKETHQQLEEKVSALLSKYTQAELQLVIRFLADYTKGTEIE